MRVYLPATVPMLRALLAGGEHGPAPLTAFAVTPGMREWYRDDDIEALEYAALHEAARAALRLLDADPAAARRRAVLSADVPAEVRDDLDRGVVRLAEPVALERIAAIHIDDADAQEAIARAAAAVIAADLGDPAAQDTVDDADGYELSWYATQELETLLGGL
jgi:hypothetical protein